MKKTAIIFLFCVSVFSCRKKEENQVNTVTPADSPYTVSTATLYSGTFLSSWETYSASLSVSTPTYAFSQVIFSQIPFNTSFGDSLRIDKLLVNGQLLEYRTHELQYMGEHENFEVEHWDVEGSNGIPSFRYTNSNSPDCNHYFTFPDTVFKSQSLTLQVNGVKEATKASMVISNYQNPNIVEKPINNGDNNIFFTPSELSVLSTSNSGYISISIENTQVLNFYGKDFKFTKQRVFTKTVKVSP